MPSKELNKYDIPVTKTFLPPKSEYEAFIKKIWDHNWLTNNDQIVKVYGEK